MIIVIGRFSYCMSKWNEFHLNENSQSNMLIIWTYILGLNLFILHRLRNKFSERLSSSRYLLPWWTGTRDHCVVCERHEVQSRRRRELNPWPTNPWSDTLPLDQRSSTVQLYNFCTQYWFQCCYKKHELYTCSCTFLQLSILQALILCM